MRDIIIEDVNHFNYLGYNISILQNKYLEIKLINLTKCFE